MIISLTGSKKRIRRYRYMMGFMFMFTLVCVYMWLYSIQMGADPALVQQGRLAACMCAGGLIGGTIRIRLEMRKRRQIIEAGEQPPE